MKNLLAAIVLIFQICACNSSQNKNAQSSSDEILYQPKFAKRFTIEKSGNDKKLIVHNPWQGSKNVRFEYTLTENKNNADAIKIPVERVICLSSTHVAFVDFIGETDKIFGVSGANYISNQKIQKAFAENKILDVGYESGLSYEVIAALKPDLVFAYGVEGEMGNVETKLKSMGIQLVYIGEYLENTPLAKAEWAIAVAAFFGKEVEAVAKFNEIEQKYDELKQLVAAKSQKPKVLINAPYRDVWYIPAEKSAMVTFIKDAGGNYIFDGEENAESKPVSIEYAYMKALDADVWINQNAEKSLGDITTLDKRLGDIAAFKNQRVYNNIKRQTVSGGSDFWESGVVNPHLILQDLIKIFHPELLPDYELYYYSELK